MAAVEASLRAINPDFERSWIAGCPRVARPLGPAGAARRAARWPGLPLDTGLPGLFHASLAHIYPDDRGVSLALGLGHRAGGAAGDWLGAARAATADGAGD